MTYTDGYGGVKPMATPRFAIGQQFVTRGKVPRLCTVTDILRTYNARDELIRVRYVATHMGALGQAVTDHDVTETAVAMGEVNQ